MMAITALEFESNIQKSQCRNIQFCFSLNIILVFGFIGGGGRMSLHVAFDKQTDTTTEMYHAIRTLSGLIVENDSEDKLKDALTKGRLHAIIKLTKNNSGIYNIDLISSGCR